MDLQFWWMLFKLIIFLPIIIILILMSLKYGGNKLQDMQNKRFIKILERAAISKENSLLVVKIGKKGYVMSSSTKSMEIIKELTEDELQEVEDQRNNQYYIENHRSLKEILNKFQGKNIYNKLKKEERNEQK